MLPERAGGRILVAQPDVDPSEDPFNAWGISVKEALTRNGFPSNKLVGPLVEFAQEGRELSALSALVVAVSRHPLVGLCAKVAVYVHKDHIFNKRDAKGERDVSPVLEIAKLKSRLLGQERVDPWNAFLPLMAYKSLTADDINSGRLSPEDLQEGYIFIGGIWYDRSAETSSVSDKSP